MIVFENKVILNLKGYIVGYNNDDFIRDQYTYVKTFEAFGKSYRIVCVTNTGRLAIVCQGTDSYTEVSTTYLDYIPGAFADLIQTLKTL